MMRSFIISLTIFCAISWTGFALKCLDCKKENGDSCDGVSVDCPDSTECLVVSEFYKNGDATYHSIKKGCNPGLPCNSNAYISNFKDQDLRLNIQCCTGDNCNKDDYQMPPEQKEHNGRYCVACSKLGTTECEENQMVKCLNEEDKCLDYLGTYKDPGNNINKNSVKGCASPMACMLKFGGMIGIHEIESERFECTE